MLKQLTLRNFVLVESLDIAFKPGLTTITGESGAGKSILLNALSLLLGERARTDVVRPGTDKADVSAEFDLTALTPLIEQLRADELAAEEPEQCLVRRVVSAQGRSRAFINGVPVTTQYLRSLGQQLVEVYGQNEHLRLASRTNQQSLLDDYAGLTGLAQDVARQFSVWRGAIAAIAEAEAVQSTAADRRDLLSYQLQELDDLGLAAGEFEELAAEHRRLASAHDTLAVLDTTLAALDDDDALRHSKRQVESIDDDHPSLTSALSNLETALSLLDDTVRDLRRFQDQVIVDPQALQLLEARLNSAQDLARKHKVAPAELASQASRLRGELERIDAGDSDLLALRQRADAAHQAYNTQATKLSRARKRKAPDFGKVVSRVMGELGIADGAFSIAFESTAGEHGLERTEFQVTTNPNFAPGPLAQVASGGEQTRISLAIQLVAAETSALPCLILDEADVGVGGTTADTVGRILRQLGQHTQVICVTHAPQVAALGDNHYCVVKHRDHTDVHDLDIEHRIDELARMLAGSDITDKTREYAAALLEGASEAEPRMQYL